jgi:hypothetical protein
MSMDRRLEYLEDITKPRKPPQKPFVVVSGPGEGPTDPAEREAWLQSKVPPGVDNVVFIQVVYEDLPHFPRSLGLDRDSEEA